MDWVESLRSDTVYKDEGGVVSSSYTRSLEATVSTSRAVGRRI